MRSRRAFTLIELLVVLVIIGILATIASMRYWRTRERAHVATMQSDLRTLVTAEESFKGDSLRYTTDLSQLPMLRTSVGVTIVVDNVTSRDWHARATHTSTSVACEVTGPEGSSPGAGIPVCQ